MQQTAAYNPIYATREDVRDAEEVLVDSDEAVAVRVAALERDCVIVDVAVAAASSDTDTDRGCIAALTRASSHRRAACMQALQRRTA